jgi:hypothetical protein
MKIVKTMYSSISSIMVTPSDFERRKKERERRSALAKAGREHGVMVVIASCKTTDHTQSCRDWIADLLVRGEINLMMFEGLDKAIDLKDVELVTTSLRDKTLPHLKERERQLSKIRQHHLKMVRVVSVLDDATGKYIEEPVAENVNPMIKEPKGSQS